jgi:O-antigen ligase
VLDGWWALAGAWLLIALLGATGPGAWYWPGYASGLLMLILVPLALFALLRAWAPARIHLPVLAAALLAGGLLAGLVGLGDWLLGGGTSADGLRRLAGPTFSPNHIALYLVRSLFLGVGLALALPAPCCRGLARQRTALLLGCGMLAVMLFLTGSRGALLLGVPAGLAVLALLGPGASRRLRRAPRRHWFAGLAIALMLATLLAWALGPRLSNSATAGERLMIWSLSAALWRDYPLLGVGPDGFIWRFPALLPVDSTLDPNLRHPHNLWLELATQGGLAALAWLAAAIALAWRWTSDHRTCLTWPQAGLAAGLVAGLAHGQVDAFQALPDLAAWNWTALALILAWPKTESLAETRSHRSVQARRKQRAAESSKRQ